MTALTTVLPRQIDTTILSKVELVLLNMLWELFLKYPAPELERERFVKALVFAFQLHTRVNKKRDTRRKSKESYFIHDLRCAIRALISGAELNMATIMLSHEFVEDDKWNYERLCRHFGKEIATIVVAGSKPPPGFPTPLDRLIAYLKRMGKDILKGQYYWKLLLEKMIDCCDNTHDTAGLNDEEKKRLFGETESQRLPFFRQYLIFIPPTLLPFCRGLLFDIFYACANYNQGVANGTNE